MILSWENATRKENCSEIPSYPGKVSIAIVEHWINESAGGFLLLSLFTPLEHLEEKSDFVQNNWNLPEISIRKRWRKKTQQREKERKKTS